MKTKKSEWTPGEFPPRGSGNEGRRETMPSAAWGHPWQLGQSWTWAPGRILIGNWDRRLIGRQDDRHLCMIAGSRAGKSSTVLIPNLLTYPGSAFVIDPKGDLVRATAAARVAMGQKVYVLDPFGVSGWPSSSHNPFDELGRANPKNTAADAAQLADAAIIQGSGEPHWTDSSKNWIKGGVLQLLSTRPKSGLYDLRRLMNETPPAFEQFLQEMLASTAYGGVVSNIGRSFLGKFLSGSKELSGIMSTMQEQTAPLDDILAVTRRSDFHWSDLKTGSVTVYLVLPAMRMGTHFRWLRMEAYQLIAAMEATASVPGRPPVLMVLEEMATLGHLRPIETAAGFMAGFGLRLWVVLQDLTQLKSNYAKSWETFLANCGLIQAFGVSDQTTTEYLSRALGTAQVMEVQDVRTSGAAMRQGDLGRRENIRNPRLLDPNEITMHFARETNRQLILCPGRPPIYLNRLPHGWRP